MALEAIPNRKAYQENEWGSIEHQPFKSYFQHFKDWCGDSYGIFRTVQFTEKTLKLVAQYPGNSMADACENVAGECGKFMGVLGLFDLPGDTEKGVKALSSRPNGMRDVVKRIENLTNAVTTWGYARLLIGNDPVVKTVVGYADVVGNCTKLGLNAFDSHRAYNEAKGYDHMPAVKERLTATARHAFLKTVAATVSVSLAALGAIAVIFGGPVLPAAALITLGLVGTITHIYAAFYKATRPWKMVDADEYAV